MFVNIYPMCIVVIHSNRFDLSIDEVNPLFLSMNHSIEELGT